MVVCNLNDVVLLTGFRVGVVRYRGNIVGRNAIHVGIEIFMSDSEEGDCDGSYQGRQYFQCSKSRGLFIPETSVQRIITAEELLNKLIRANEDKKNLQQENENYEVSLKLYLKKSSQWKEALANLEAAIIELETELEFAKQELMLREREKQKLYESKWYDVADDDPDKAENDPFHLISKEDSEGLQAYLSKNNHDDIDAFSDAEKGNLAIWAVRNSNYSAIKILAKFHADLDQCDEMGWNPLIYSIIYDDYEMAKLLVKHGADIEYVDICSPNSWTPVIFCCILNNSKILNLLAKNKANLDVCIAANKTPLVLCAERGYYKCLKVLRNYDVDLIDALNIVKQSNHKEMSPMNRKTSIQLLCQ
mmetsp:Transcript_23887/g.37919  ORF Transcript_23887/g.37919 Transcript_23887/m.37919 type:complete len:362 (-) Transcript_23887:231-1316(-)